MRINDEREEGNNRNLDKVRTRGRMGCGIAHQMPE